jgi:putative ABC transport system permease protein
MNLAGRDILHAWPRFLLTGAGLGLLIGVTLSMAGIYRGMVDDARALIDNSGADLWVVQHGTLGPYAEPSSLPDDLHREIAGFRGVERAANVTYLTMQVRHGETDVRAMIVGIVPGGPGAPGQPPRLVAGRPITRNHYEAVADAASGLRPGDTIRLRRNPFTVVGLTRRMVSSSGDPMIFIPLQDAQEEQFLKDNDAILRQRDATRQNPAFAAHRTPGVAEAVIASQTASRQVNAILVRLAPGADPDETAAAIRRWKRVQVYTRPQMERILIGKLIATSARQIGLFLIILAVVSAAIVAFIIYTMTLAKIREIAVLKLIGARNRTIAGMILQQALALGLIGFAVGKVVATAWAPHFPKYVLLLPGDTARGFLAVVIICTLASLLAIRIALKVDPAEAIG